MNERPPSTPQRNPTSDDRQGIVARGEGQDEPGHENSPKRMRSPESCLDWRFRWLLDDVPYSTCSVHVAKEGGAHILLVSAAALLYATTRSESEGSRRWPVPVGARQSIRPTSFLPYSGFKGVTHQILPCRVASISNTSCPLQSNLQRKATVAAHPTNICHQPRRRL